MGGCVVEGGMQVVHAGHSRGPMVRRQEMASGMCRLRISDAERQSVGGWG